MITQIACSIGIILLAIVVANYFKLFPWQYKCMYDDSSFIPRCENQCRFCREMEEFEKDI